VARSTAIAPDEAAEMPRTASAFASRVVSGSRSARPSGASTSTASKTTMRILRTEPL